MARSEHELPPELIFAVCAQWMAGDGATRIRDWVRDQGFDCTREQIHALLDKGRKLGYIRLCPPLERDLEQQLRIRYPQAADITVVNVDGPTALDYVASTGADIALQLILDLGRRKRPDPVHVGLAGGETVKRFSHGLGGLLRSEPNVPPLVLHACNSGFAFWDPMTAPTSMFTYFHDLKNLTYFGLFTEAVVREGDYENVKHSPGVRRCFDEAVNMDVVITSLASAHDEDSLLRNFMREAAENALQELESAGWVGDVMWRPYSEAGPVTSPAELRSVTLFELEDLVRLGRTPGKHVILLAGPCGHCGRTKTRALLPLLTDPNLRVYNHIVTDVRTARELLA